MCVCRGVACNILFGGWQRGVTNNTARPAFVNIQSSGAAKSRR